MKWFIRGDLHGYYPEIEKTDNFLNNFSDVDKAIIILGDAGFNFSGGLSDNIKKDVVENKAKLGNYFYYCVRGNHEIRPSNISSMTIINDINVGNNVYMEENYPHIRYFIDGETYYINGKKTLVIGGAYSVDKYYRILRGYPWFEDEQLSEDEQNEISTKYKNQSFDYVFAHTCPICWQPVDLFLDSINQDSVDSSMEKWLEKFILDDLRDYGHYYFGHYHCDREIKENVTMLFNKIEELV